MRDSGIVTAGGNNLPTPVAAEVLFGDSLPVAERYVELLATDGVHRGLIGPHESVRLWERHILNCAAIESLLPREGDVLDLGSGAGLPGVVLAIQRPTMRVLLLEPLLRRAAFLEESVTELGLANVTVVRDRAEHVAGQVVADTVVARAVAPLERLARWAIPLVRPGGRVLAMKGEGAEAELAQAASTLRSLGVIDGRLEIAAQPAAPEIRATVVVLTAGGEER